MSQSQLYSLHRLVWVALLSATVASGAYLQVPIGTVPVSLQTLFVILSGLVLGPIYGAVSIGLYLAAGLVGLPVFSGGSSGLAHLLGPTGGYLFGFVFCSAISGLAVRSGNGNMTWKSGLAWGTLGILVMYLFGVSWLKYTLEMDWLKAITVGVLPFLPASVAKLFLAVACVKFLHKNRLLPS